MVRVPKAKGSLVISSHSDRYDKIEPVLLRFITQSWLAQFLSCIIGAESRIAGFMWKANNTPSDSLNREMSR